MRNVFFCLLIGILFWGCSDENPSNSFAEVSSSSAIETFSSSIENVESSSSVVESSSSEIIISSSSGISYGELIDERDGQVYKTVKIGKQTWMAENLNYAYTKPLFKVYYGTTETIDSASFCYNNEPDSCAKYGRLYMWETNMGCASEVIEDIFKIDCPIDENDYSKTRGICPEKWHIPSVNEWKSLQNVVNHFITDLKSTEGWLDDGNGSDVFGFRILPTGYYIDYYEGFAFKDIGKKTCFWTLRQYTTALFDLGTPIDEYYYEDAYPICISSNTKDFSFNKEPKIYAFPVRCVKDQ